VLAFWVCILIITVCCIKLGFTTNEVSPVSLRIVAGAVGIEAIIIAGTRGVGNLFGIGVVVIAAVVAHRNAPFKMIYK